MSKFLRCSLLNAVGARSRYCSTFSGSNGTALTSLILLYYSHCNFVSSPACTQCVVDAGCRAEAGCLGAWNSGCSCQHSSSSLPQTLASAHCSPGTTPNTAAFAPGCYCCYPCSQAVAAESAHAAAQAFAAVGLCVPEQITAQAAQAVEQPLDLCYFL